MEDVSPDSFHKLAEKIRDDEATATLFHWNKKRRRYNFPHTCTAGCRLYDYCKVATSEDFERNDCMGEPNYDFYEEPTKSFMNMMTNVWIEKE